ncbi:unnamed protein product [Orchesella dallaii]|uniref:Uncharacterized protein n=1 Tax=Orchesella dallaii TaxID=48710 RepID=A0ABP1Q5D8_9HEXA
MQQSYPELSSDGAEESSRGGWVSMLSNGGLTEPSSVWFATFKKFEEYFNTVHSVDAVCLAPGVVKKFTMLLEESHPFIQRDILEFYSHCRLQIRIKYLNVRMEDEKIKRKESQRQDEEDQRGMLCKDYYNPFRVSNYGTLEQDNAMDYVGCGDIGNNILSKVASVSDDLVEAVPFFEEVQR